MKTATALIVKKSISESDLRQKALDLLSRRDYSRRELSRKLARYAAPTGSAHDVGSDEIFLDDEPVTPDAEGLLDDFEERGWLSDQRFAATWVRSRAGRGYGPQRLLQELRQKGVSAEEARAALDASEIDWFELALQVGRKKYPRDGWSTILNERRKEQAGVQRYLLYRGFDQEQMRYALELLGSDADESDTDW